MQKINNTHIDIFNEAWPNQEISRRSALTDFLIFGSLVMTATILFYLFVSLLLG